MKSWEHLEPDVYRLVNDDRYTKGRNGRKIDKVVIHHNAGILTVDQIWGVWRDRIASAHYQVQSNGVIGQLVNDWDTAWHAANTFVNESSLGIEVSNSAGPDQDWPISGTAIEETAHLVAAIHHAHRLGRPRDGITIRYHREFTSTSCPYHLAPGGKYHGTFWSRVLHWYDRMAAAPAPAPAPAPTGGDEVTKEQADRIEAQNRRIEQKMDLMLDQVCGKRNDQGEQEFNGWEQGGQRTLYDLAAANAAKAGVPGTRDTQEDRR